MEFEVDQPATLQHPAGDVQGTISRISATGAYVWFTFTHASGSQVELRFTRRKDGKWQQAGTAGKGKGSFTGYLVAKSGAYKVVKDGHDWDYSTHRVDAERWVAKILREEPDAQVSIQDASLEEMYAFKTGEQP